MFLVLTGLTIAQTTGVMHKGMTIWTDSIGYTNLSETSDSVLILDTKLYDWFRIFLAGNTNSQVDSIYAQAGSLRFNESKSQVDTVWGSWVALKDSAWTDTNIMINNSVGKDWLLFSPVTRLLRFALLNERDVAVYDGALVTRNCVITINAVIK